MDRLAVSVLLLLSVLVCWTSWYLPTWATDESLWSRAASVNQVSPRPAYNLAVALRVRGSVHEASEWLMEAADRQALKPLKWDYRAAVAWQFAMIEGTGVFVCDSPTVQPYCYPEP